MAGTGLTSPHPTIPNLWVREIDPTNSDLILTGVVKVSTPGVASKFVEANTYSHGCLLLKTDGTTGATAIFENVGTAASPSWGDVVETTTSTSSSTISTTSSSSSSSSVSTTSSSSSSSSSSVT